MRYITLSQLISSVCGGMIGVSALSLADNMILYGSSAYYAWILGIPAIAAITQTFAYLSMKYPNTGGPYGYARNIFGSKVGYIVGYIYLGAILIQQTAVIYASGIAYSNIFGSYIFWILPLICGCSQLTRLETSMQLNYVLNILKITPFIILILTGLGPAISHIPDTLAQPYHNITSPLTMIFFAFSGMEFNTISKTDEIKNPARNIPLALQIGTILTAIFYFGLQLTVCSVISPGESIYIAIDRILFVGAHHLLTCAGIVVGWYAICFGIMVGSQLISQLSHHGDLPSILNKYQNGSTSILCVILATLLPMIGLPYLLNIDGYSSQYKIIVEVFDFLYALVYLCCALGYFIEQRSIISIFAILSTLLFIYVSCNIYGFAIIVIGIILMLSVTAINWIKSQDLK